MKTNKSLRFDYLLHSGKILASALYLSKSLLYPGNTSLHIDKEIEKIICTNGAVPSFIDLDDFGYASCISVNEVAVHGIPNNVPLKNGDIVTVDIGVCFKGHYTDAARTFFIGPPKKNIKNLINTSYRALDSGIQKAIPKNKIGDISYSIQREIVLSGFHTTLMYGGHGIGLKPHMDPFIPNYGRAGTGWRLVEGMCLAIEPILLQKKEELMEDHNGCNIHASKNNLSAHVEDTVIVNNPPIVLTRKTLSNKPI